MNKKLIAIIVIIIIVAASVAAYTVYSNNPSNTDPSSTPTLTPNSSPTSSPTVSPTPTHSTSPTATAIPPVSDPSPTSSTPEELRVFIAASLVHVLDNMTAEFEKANNCHIVRNSDSSSALYQQIINGAPCDVFMAADQKWTKQLLTTSPYVLNSNYVNFTTNSLEVIVAPGNPAGITSLADLARPGIKVVLAAPSVPAGSYANSTLWKIQSRWAPTDPAYANFNASVYQNVVSYENTVEQVVGKVSLGVGTADVGIVFYSDAVWDSMTNAAVTFLPIPSDVNTRGTYGIGVVGSTTHAYLAEKFMNYWLSTEGQALLMQFGFNS
jgi:molybdate transport system substrate-binding protein